MTEQHGAGPSGPPRPVPPHHSASAAVLDGSEGPSSADSSEQVHRALSLDLRAEADPGSGIDLSSVIDTLTQAHQALNVRLTNTPH